MRKRLFQLLLSAILVTAAVISVIIGRFSYDFVKTVLRENREEKILRIENQLDHYQSILLSIEKKMDEEGSKALLQLARYFPDPVEAERVSAESLKLLSKRLGVDDIYFIGADGRVFNSSLKADINLNLLAVSPSFTRYINSIYGRGEVISQGISVSVNEGKVNHYMYYSPKGSRIIYEISMDVQSFVNKEYNFALYEFLFGDMFKNFYNDYLESIDIYSIAGGTGWSLVNQGKKLTLDNDILKLIIAGGEAVVEKGDRINVYRRIKMNKYIFNRTTAVYVELIYDVSILSQYTRRIILYSLFSCIVISAIIFFLSTMKMNDMFIKRVQNIIENLKRIKNGDYNIFIDDNTGDEISDISANINLMTRTIQQRSGEISRTNEQLTQMTIFINDIIDSMPSALISINEKERIIQWNREAEIFSGVTAAEAEGRTLWDVIPQLYRYRSKCEEVRQKRVKVELYGESFVVETSGRETVYTKNIYIFPFSRERITGVIIRIDDVTELAKKEEQLERAVRAEALGTMAGGLAHDFNNIISGIIGTVSYLNLLLSGREKVDLDEVRSQLEIMRNSGVKAADLVRSLMSFSRKKSLEFNTVDLKKIITEVSEIASASAARDIDLRVNAGEAESFISGDRTQLEQVILNLIVNAAEAIREKTDPQEGGGVILLTLDRVMAGDKPIVSPGGYLWHVAVADNGPGIDKVALERIFDPFFTTKKDGNGLGLAIVNTIITAHDGMIEVESQIGAGTVFNIFLPALK